MAVRSFAALAALSALLVAAPASAQEEDSAPKDASKGFYATLSAGGSWLSSPSISSTDAATNTTVEGNWNLGGGVAAEAGFGYDFGNNVRAQLSYVLNTASLGDGSYSGTASGIPFTGTISQSGTASTNSVFVSGYYDIPTKSKFTPYVGAGIGWTSVTIPSGDATATVTALGRTVTAVAPNSGGSASAFGYTAKIGVSYAVSKPADLFIEGVYQGNTSVTIDSDQIGALNSFGARAGLRYRFGS